MCSPQICPPVLLLGCRFPTDLVFFCAPGEVAGVLLVSWDSEGGNL